MENKGAEVNKELAHRRADSFYMVYAAMGAERSLEKLREVLAGIGLDISLNTLKSYSARHGWVEKASTLPVQPIVESEVISEMNQRHVAMGKTMQELALDGLKNFSARQMTAGEASRLLKVGSELERLASGGERSKYEVAVEIMNPIVQDICELFVRVNEVLDPDTRKKDFARGADAILKNTFGNVFPREARQQP